MQKHEFYTQAFTFVGENNTLLGDQHMPAIESFMCALYGRPRIMNVNYVRYEMSQQHFAPKNTSINGPLGKLKGINPNSKTPCHAIIYRWTKWRGQLISCLVGESCQKVTSIIWLRWQWLETMRYDVTWYDGEQVPRNLSQRFDRDIFKIQMTIIMKRTTLKATICRILKIQILMMIVKYRLYAGSCDVFICYLLCW